MLLLLLAILGLDPLAATSVSEQPHTRVELIAEPASVAPGKNFTIGIAMTPRPGWHSYWENPGDSGMPTSAKWTLPDGVSISALRYPVPETYVVSGIMNHVYGAENVLLAEVTVPASHAGALPLALKLDWLICDDSICVPEAAELALVLPQGNGTADPGNAARFAAARAALPRALGETAGFALADGRIRLSVPMAATDRVTGAHFFAADENSLLFAAPQTLSRTESALIVEADLVPNAAPAEVRGLIRVERGDEVLGFTLRAVPAAVEAGQPLNAAAATGAMDGFLLAFGLAVLGGLVLNLMPCVFPILSLKAMSLAKAGHSEAAARSEGLAYTGGVILVTSLLGAAAIALSRAGEGAGWAFQLQDPRVILLLMLLTFVIGLNFAGLFEVQLRGTGAGQQLTARPGARGAFWTGALAAFVATPCTGPFMAGALGAALILPPVAGLAVFAGLGLGLALPFLAIGFVPGLRRRLPRPGAWMLGFRRILAVPMFLTALALAWVLGRQAGSEGLMIGLFAALGVALGLWWLGLRQQRQAAGWLPIAAALAATVAAPVALARMPQTEGTAKAAPDTLQSVAFSPDRLAELTNAGTPTFLYFTADWCLTCKVNEKGALSSREVASAFDKAGIQVMVGDWTRPDPAIARFLEERKRAGIPLYLFYGRDGSIVELPQILTTDTLIATAMQG